MSLLAWMANFFIAGEAIDWDFCGDKDDKGPRHRGF